MKTPQNQNLYLYLHPYPYQEPIEKTVAGARLAQSTSLATSVHDAAAPTANSARHACNERQTGAAQVRAVPAAHRRGIHTVAALKALGIATTCGSVRHAREPVSVAPLEVLGIFDQRRGFIMVRVFALTAKP